MKNRQLKKILKQSGTKLHQGFSLSTLEKRVCDHKADSNVSKAIYKLREECWKKGTLYSDSHIKKLKEVIEDGLKIENITGVKK